jgi:hypothetical protein
MFLVFCLSKVLFSQFILNNSSLNSEDYIYFDDFSTDKGLIVNNDGVSRGEYHFKYYKLSSSSSTLIGLLPINVSVDSDKDFQIEASIKYVSGEDNNGNGIIWGKSNYGWSNFYSFAFTGNGSFAIGKKENNEWKNSIIPWTSSKYLNSEGYNKLTIRKIANNYYFFINENLVHQCPFENLSGDEIWLYSNSNSTIYISEIAISYFKGNSQKKEVETLKPIHSTNKPYYSSRNNNNVSLEKIEINKKYTVVTMTCSTEREGYQFWFGENAYIRAGDKNYHLVKSEVGNSHYDCNLVKKGEPKTFNLYFDRIDEGFEEIDILEDELISTAFNFFNVKIKNPKKEEYNPNSGSSESNNSNNSENKTFKVQSLNQSEFIFNEIIPGVQLVTSEEEWLNLSPKKACCCYPEFNEKNKSLGLLYNKIAFEKVKFYLLNSQTSTSVCSPADWQEIFSQLRTDTKKISSLQLNIYPGFYDFVWYSPNDYYSGYWIDENTMVSFSNDSYGEPMIDEAIYNDTEYNRQSLIALSIRIIRSIKNSCDLEKWHNENISTKGNKNQIKFISKLSDWNIYSPKQPCCCYINFDLNNDSYGFLYNLKAYELLKTDESLKAQGYRVALEKDWNSILTCLNTNGGFSDLFNCDNEDYTGFKLSPNGYLEFGDWNLPENGKCNFWISDMNNANVLEFNCADKTKFKFSNDKKNSELENRKNYSAFMIRFIKM